MTEKKKSREILLGVLITYLPILSLFLTILFSNNFFTYTLDDPYIHLELAKNIFGGNHGINITEFSAPSSSIIFPFILAPFSNFQFYLFIPFLYNSIFFILTAYLLIIFFKDTFKNTKYAIVASFLFLFSINAYGLVFTGMEHSLHLLLTIFTTVCLLNKNWLMRYNFLFYLSIILSPLVRFEGMAISLPTLFYIYSTQSQERKKSIYSFMVLFACIIGYASFLYFNIGEFLPSSVLAKQNSLSGGGIKSVVRDIFYMLKEYGWFFCIAFFIIWRVNKKDVFFTTFVGSTILLFISFGAYGWYGRYEVFFLSFILLLLIKNLYKIFKFKRGHIIAFSLMPFLFVSLIFSTLTVPLASSNIYNQQYLLSQFVKKFNRPVAVNDLGLISYFSDRYVLDLWGLGNYEALKSRKNKEVDFISNFSKKYNTELLIIYSDWFSSEELSAFIHVADLYLKEKRITPASSKVSFYVSEKNLISEVQNQLLDFDFEGNILEIF